jgi:hypothetical protein
MHAMQS